MKNDNDNLYNLSSARGKRSSLRIPNSINSNDIFKKKRNSVSFKFGENFQFKELRARFQETEPNKVNEEKNNKFNEARKKSIKNEFSLVKELLKKQHEEIEEVENEEVIENTNKNLQVGKEYEDSDSNDSKSQKSEDSNKDKD
jgi:hypothetical protein